MSNNKSPGSSGFSAEFYKMFWKKIGIFVIRALNEAFTNGNLSITQTHGIIICIPKGDKSRLFLQNWRPITLLNTVYKIGSGVIANRLKLYMNKLISNDQTGFIKGRYIGENTRLIYDIMHYTEENQIPGLLLLIDFEKAFDSLSWSFVQNTLSLFNFGPDIKRWFHILYKDSKSAVSQCGYLSDFFPIERGCRQGDPLSCYIFILCAEVLSILLRQNNKIKGITIDGIEHKLSQFADDTTIILDGKEESLNETLNTLQHFSNLSGLNVNFEKTKVVWIGRQKYSSDSIKTKWKLKWKQQSFKMLGINFHVDLSKIIDLNYTEKLDQMEKLIKNWKRRILTPIGKIVVVKTLIVSLFNHLFISLPNPPSRILDIIKSSISSFIWDGHSRVKLSTLVREYKEGGLNMINLANFVQALKLTWLKRIQYSLGKWVDLIKMYFDVRKLFICGPHYALNISSRICNPFWIDVLKSYSNYCNVLDMNVQEFLQYPLFYNPDILIGKKSFFFKSWFDAGVHYIGDILNSDGTFMTLQDFNRTYNMNIDFLIYTGVTRAILKLVKKYDISIPMEIPVLQKYRPFMPPLVKLILNQESGAKRMYNILNKNCEILLNQEKWEKQLNTKISQKEWNCIYATPFEITSDSKIQWFQYRIVHKIIGTNSLLHKMKITNDPLCTFCKQYDETIEHLFWECHFSKIIINSLFPVQSFSFVNKTNFLLGLSVKKSHAINTIFILTKLYIYKCKMNKHVPSINGTKNYLKYEYDNLKSIATSKNNLESFERDWGEILSVSLLANPL
jgi:hypothetical protein